LKKKNFHWETKAERWFIRALMQWDLNYYRSKPFRPYGVRGGFMVYVTVGIATWPSSPPLGLYDLFFTDLDNSTEKQVTLLSNPVVGLFL